MYKEILVPLDGSELAERALPHATTLAKQFGARVTLLSVAESVVVYSQPGVIGPVVSVAMSPEQETEHMREYLSKVEESIRAQGIDVRRVVKQGEAASQICDYAKEADTDLIVMSTHGRSGIQRWVYGSVADRVLRAAHIPVLLIRTQPDERQ